MLILQYSSINDANEVYEDNKATMEDPKYSNTLQPIKDYRMVLYGNGRIATLERLKDGGRIIWCRDSEGDEIYSFPLFIYLFIYLQRYQRQSMAYLVEKLLANFLHKPKGSANFVIIRK